MGCQPMADTASEAQALRKGWRPRTGVQAEIKRMEDQLGLNGEKPKGGQAGRAALSGGFNLPSEQEVDRRSRMERMVKFRHDEAPGRLTKGKTARRDLASRCDRAATQPCWRLDDTAMGARHLLRIRSNETNAMAIGALFNHQTDVQLPTSPARSTP
jgi:hypothetical protein